jgi:hypothetical protein
MNCYTTKFTFPSYQNRSYSALLHRILLIGLVSVLAGCGNRKVEPVPVTVLASTINISIGGAKLRLPAVAITGPSNARSTVVVGCPEAIQTGGFCSVNIKELGARAGRREDIAGVVMLKLRFEEYDSYEDTSTDQSFYFPQLCAMLTQRWAKRACESRRSFRAFPKGLVLIDESYLVELSKKRIFRPIFNSEFVVTQAMADQKTSIVCEMQSVSPREICTVIRRLNHGLVASWWYNRADSVDRQAGMIEAFIEHAAGTRENLEMLDATLRGDN